MSGVDPKITLHQDGPFCYRAQMEYTADTLDEMAHRAAERIEDELVQQILARLGYVKPVRCIECRRASIGSARPDLGDPVLCHRSDWYVRPDGYCAWGVRKEDE